MTSSNRGASIVLMALCLATATGLMALAPSSRARGVMEDEPAAPNPASQADADKALTVEPGVAGAVDQMAEQLKRGPIDRTPNPDRFGLFLLDVASGNATLITDEPDPGRMYCGSPCWSPDGRRILFDATPGTDWGQTHLKSIDLADESLEITDLGPGNCPEFSPDGEWIAFLVNSGESPNTSVGVWAMRKDGSDRKQLDAYGIPKWSPDGRQLLISSFGTPAHLWIMDVDVWRPRSVQLPGYSLLAFPRWVAPGILIASAASDEGSGVALFDVTDPEEGKLKEILWKRGDRLDATPSHLIFSPVTRACVFVAQDSNGMALYSVRQGSFGPPRRLEPNGYDNKIEGLAFSPDGRYVLFSSNRLDRRAAGVAVDAEGSEPSIEVVRPGR